MLQRVGRTGRKRDGRVVFLVAEGPEEKTYKDSKMKERTIIRAMKRPDAFTVAPTVPMLPAIPRLCERDMQRAQKFHLTQVEGHGESTKTTKSSITKKSSTISEDKSWRLSKDSEARRAAALGDSNSVKSLGDHAMLSLIRTRLLSARHLNTQSFQKKTDSMIGRTTSLLRAFERNFPMSLKGSKRRKQHPIPNGNAQTTAICAWFPIAKGESAFEALAWGKPHQRLTSTSKNRTRDDSNTRTMGPIDSSLSAIHGIETATDTGAPDTIERRSSPGKPHGGAIALQNDSLTSCHHYAEEEHISNTSEKVDLPCSRIGSNDGVRSTDIEKANVRVETTALQEPASGDPLYAPTSRSSAEANASEVTCTLQGPDTTGSLEAVPNTAVLPIDNSYELPTPSSSSDEESIDDGYEDKNIDQPVHVSSSEKHEHTPPLRPDNDEREVEHLYQAFSLPTQSSSSDDESSQESEKPLDVASKDIQRRDSGTVVGNSHTVFAEFGAEKGNKRKRQNNDVRQSKDMQRHDTDPARISGNGKALDSDSDDDSSSSEVIRTRPAKSKRRRVIDESPECQMAKEELVGSSQGGKEENAVRPPDGARKRKTIVCLEDSSVSTGEEAKVLPFIAKHAVTRESSTHPDDIVCAICQSGESPEEDPIYLCDGPGNSVDCDLAVHASCYSMKAPDPEDDWRCDRCAHIFRGGSNNIKCLVCGAKNGPLKKISNGKWAHAFCMDALPSSIRHNSPVIKSNEEKAGKRRRKFKKPMKRHYSHFLEEEASISSNEDIDGDEADEKDIVDIEEEEELHSSFINDSSQLGYAADGLEDSEDENEQEDVHRALDRERDSQNKFKTPVLNRRMVHSGGRQGGSSSRRKSTASSTIDSEKGLGNMHFIRSVIDHHRQGGTAEEIERVYEQMEAETEEEEESPFSEVPAPSKTVIAYTEEKDSDDEWPE